MFISRVEIDRTNRRKLKDLSHLEAYHAWVERCFPSEFDAAIRTRKLWRIDEIQDKEFLLIVSEQQPDLQRLEKYGVPGTSQTKPYQNFLSQLTEGSRMRFRVVLNPVISVTSSNKNKRGVVKPHVTVGHQKQFLLERSAKYGFSLNEEEFSIVNRGYAIFNKATKPLRLIRVAYEGTLTITDTTLFQKLLTEGMGKKKAYGFGLMTVIPLDT